MQNTFNIQEIENWLQSNRKEGIIFISSVLHNLSDENIIKANLEACKEAKEDMELRTADTDWDLYPGNEAGAFDEEDHRAEYNEFKNLSEHEYEDWCKKKGYA